MERGKNMNDIDDSLVEEAIEYEVHNNKKQFHKWKSGGVLFYIIVLKSLSDNIKYGRNKYINHAPSWHSSTWNISNRKLLVFRWLW